MITEIWLGLAKERANGSDAVAVEARGVNWSLREGCRELVVVIVEVPPVGVLGQNLIGICNRGRRFGGDGG